MSWTTRPHVAAPTRLSLHEALSAGKRPTIFAIRRAVSRDRMFRAPAVMSAAEAAWALCVEVAQIYNKAIRNGALPAKREYLSSDRYRWRIRCSDVEKLAEELYETDDDRVESIRLAEFEGRAGEP